MRGARDGDELVVGREEREKRAPDDSGRAKDRDLHMLALDASSRAMANTLARATTPARIARRSSHGVRILQGPTRIVRYGWFEGGGRPPLLVPATAAT